MKIMIINCHTANRGDEAAVHALVDEILLLYPECSITLALRGETTYPNLPKNVKVIQQVVPNKNDIKYRIAYLTKGKVAVGNYYKTFVSEVQQSDIILHAPGGPSIGDTYYDAEDSYLYTYDLIRSMKKPYMFYAPSMGPFNIQSRNEWRKRVISGAKAVALRDPISARHVTKLLPNIKVYQTLDSAIQHDIEITTNERKLNLYSELKVFLDSHKRCVGITITDLLWHPIHSKDNKVQQSIGNSFTYILERLTENGYGIVFIPQLYGVGNDYELMKSYCVNSKDYFIIPDNDERYDTYFQQYLIGQLYAVIGMRYHSNIFSAKMGTPFISVSYEQKMRGFMEKMNLSNYCLSLEELNPAALLDKFLLLEKNYAEYKNFLNSKHNQMKKESYKTTDVLIEVIDEIKESR